MKKFKLENNLAKDDLQVGGWQEIPSVYVSGNKKALPINLEKDEEYNEAVRESWEKVVILHVMSPKPIKFYLGFTDKFVTKYLKQEFESDLKFGMRVGPKNFQVIVLPKNLGDKIFLEVVEYTKDKDEKYKDLILI